MELWQNTNSESVRCLYYYQSLRRSRLSPYGCGTNSHGNFLYAQLARSRNSPLEISRDCSSTDRNRRGSLRRSKVFPIYREDGAVVILPACVRATSKIGKKDPWREALRFHGRCTQHSCQSEDWKVLRNLVHIRRPR